MYLKSLNYRLLILKIAHYEQIFELTIIKHEKTKWAERIIANARTQLIAISHSFDSTYFVNFTTRKGK